jgi:lipopolysaccharide/colanic/teichoic acid biosynthesis glycosyltransferase
MRKYLYLSHDLACLCIALVMALYLRHGIPLIQEGQPADLYLLLLVTVIAGLCVLPLMRTHTSIWRFTASSDIMNILIAVALTILISNSILFLISRLQMMPRSVPPMQWALAVVMMASSRMIARQWLGLGSNDKNKPIVRQHVIVLGACHTASLYLHFIKRILPHDVTVDGLIDSDPTLTDRMFQQYRILGTPEHLSKIIEQFHVHGIHITHIVLAQPLSTLLPGEQQQLRELEAAGVIELIHFAQHMVPQIQPQNQETTSEFAIRHDAAPGGMYRFIKRGIDVLMGLTLAIIFLPVMAITAVLVAMDVGLPVIFWQQRPGLHGVPFRLVKFRTMQRSRRRRDEPRLSHKSSDESRTSPLGKWLRRFRLDELPQIFHVVAGTMSFVGPRPLLPDDQPADGAIRLSVRPGITGWAQIHGGDALTPDEKLALDRWYIEHCSLWLDALILFRTLLVVLKEDKKTLHSIKNSRKGAVRT